MLPEPLNHYYQSLPEKSRVNLDTAVARVVDAKQRGGKVMLVIGSGPNLHEGVTTLIAELMVKDIVDSVTTSSAVIAHEMGGTLDRVKRVRVPVWGTRRTATFCQRAESSSSR